MHRREVNIKTFLVFLEDNDLWNETIDLNAEMLESTEEQPGRGDMASESTSHGGDALLDNNPACQMLGLVKKRKYDNSELQ